MKIALVGYGRMGKEVEQIALQRGHDITVRVDPSSSSSDLKTLSAKALSAADGVIEFSLASAVASNAKIYAEAGIAAVVGTTGWDKDREKVERTIRSASGSFLYGSNFSIGAHLMFDIVRQAARLIRNFDYDISVSEIHHKLKADSPSGTALSLAEAILENLPRKTTIQTQSLDRPIRPEELHVSSTRVGHVPGIHTVLLDSEADSIEITHNARNRHGFALGAVLGLEWLQGRTGFYRVEDFIAALTAS